MVSTRSSFDECRCTFDVSKSPHGAIVDDETIPSFLRRVALLSGYRSDFWSIQAAMSRKGAPLEGMPAPLRLLCEAFPQLGEVDDLLCSRHLLFNYWTSCADEDHRSRVRSTMIEASPGPIRPCHLPIDLEPSAHDSFHCPDCDALNVVRFGFAPTLVVHVAPFISVCPVHGAFTFERNRRGLFASECVDTTNSLARQRSQAFGQRTQLLMQSAITYEERIQCLRTSLLERGFMSEQGRVRWKQFLACHIAFHSEPFADARLSIVSRNTDLIRTSVSKWISGRSSLHPVLYVLVEWSLSEVICSKAIAATTSARRRVITPDAVRDAIAREGTLSSAARSLGLTTTTLATHAEKAGIAIRRKPSKLKSDIRAAVECSFGSGSSVENIAGKFSISLSSVYRILRASDAGQRARATARHEQSMRDRKRWLELVNKMPAGSLNLARHSAPALFGRLYRAGQLPKPPQYAKALPLKLHRSNARPRYLHDESARSISSTRAISGQDRRQRLSLRHIGVLTGLSQYVLARPGEEAHRTIAATCETDAAFVERRINESCATARTSATSIKRWAALSLAGLRLMRRRLQIAHLD